MASIRENLIAFYNCSEGSGTSIGEQIYNASIVYNTTNFGGGKVGNGCSLDGSHTASGSVTQLPTGATTRSIALWFLVGSIAGGDTLISWGSASDSQACQLQVLSSSAFRFSGWNNDKDWTTTINTSTWYHVVFTYDGGTSVKLYWNGSLISTQSLSGALNTTGTTLRFGAAVNGGGTMNGGTVDEVGIWNRELSAAEVTLLYNGGNGVTYPFRSQMPAANTPYIQVGGGMGRSERAT